MKNIIKFNEKINWVELFITCKLDWKWICNINTKIPFLNFMLEQFSNQHNINLDINVNYTKKVTDEEIVKLVWLTLWKVMWKLLNR